MLPACLVRRWFFDKRIGGLPGLASDLAPFNVPPERAQPLEIQRNPSRGCEVHDSFMISFGWAIPRSFPFSSGGGVGGGRGNVVEWALLDAAPEGPGSEEPPR